MDMLDRMQTGRFKVFRVDRSQGYTCDPKQSLPGADRALTDIAAAVEVLRRRPDVARQPILMAGISRGGILSIAYAGMHPGEVAGVINFVGGWMGEGCPNASEINGTLFKRGVPASDLVALRQPRPLLQPRPQPRELCRVPRRRAARVRSSTSRCQAGTGTW